MMLVRSTVLLGVPTTRGLLYLRTQLLFSTIRPQILLVHCCMQIMQDNLPMRAWGTMWEKGNTSCILQLQDLHCDGYRGHLVQINPCCTEAKLHFTTTKVHVPQLTSPAVSGFERHASGMPFKRLL